MFAEGVDGRMDLQGTHGTAPRDWFGFLGHHREIRQVARADEFHRVVEQVASDDGRITDCREQPTEQLEEQRSRGESGLFGSGRALDESQFTRIEVVF